MILKNDCRLTVVCLCCRFSTGFGVTGGSALIHEFYAREVSNPVHLTVDTGFKNGEAAIKGFVSINLSLGDQQLAAQFQEIPLDLRMVEAERVGCMYLTLKFIEILTFHLDTFVSTYMTGPHMQRVKKC